jgi:hypothetical protein
MATKRQDRKDISARPYLRPKRQIQFWRWGKKKLNVTESDVTESETERPWAGVAEWLRVAHSMLDEKAVELTRSTD